MKLFIISVAILGMSGLSAHSQSLCPVGQKPRIDFAYDELGYRTTRQVVCVSSVRAADTTRAVEVIEGQVISVFPNPTPGKLSIEIKGLEPDTDWRYSLFDLKGNQLMGAKVKEARLTTDLQQLSTGAYILQVYYQGRKKDFKIIKE